MLLCGCHIWSRRVCQRRFLFWVRRRRHTATLLRWAGDLPLEAVETAALGLHPQALHLSMLVDMVSRGQRDRRYVRVDFARPILVGLTFGAILHPGSILGRLCLLKYGVANVVEVVAEGLVFLRAATAVTFTESRPVNRRLL